MTLGEERTAAEAPPVLPGHRGDSTSPRPQEGERGNAELSTTGPGLCPRSEGENVRTNSNEIRGGAPVGSPHRVLLTAFCAVTPALAQNPTQCGEAGVGPLCFYDLTAPNIIGDSNLNGQPLDGPRVFSIAAKICNEGAVPLSDIYVFVGDGTTPGNFPETTVPPPTAPPYIFPDNYRLDVLTGSTGTRFEGTQTLAVGQCLAFYFPVRYRVVDTNGDALWGKSNTPNDDLYLDFTIWGTATNAVPGDTNAFPLSASTCPAPTSATASGTTSTATASRTLASPASTVSGSR